MTHWLDVGQDGLNYLEKCLSNGRTLSKLLSQRIAVSSGITKALVPDNVDPTQLRKFETGGLLLAANGAPIKVGVDAIAVAKPSLVTVMAETITKLLQTNPDRICVFEEQVMRPGDPSTLTPPNLLLKYRDELYHVCLPGDVNAKVERTLRKANSWACTGVITFRCGFVRCQGEMVDVTRESLEAIVAGAQCVIVAAYDGESFVVWAEEPYWDQISIHGVPHKR